MSLPYNSLFNYKYIGMLEKNCHGNVKQEFYSIQVWNKVNKMHIKMFCRGKIVLKLSVRATSASFFLLLLVDTLVIFDIALLIGKRTSAKTELWLSFNEWSALSWKGKSNLPLTSFSGWSSLWVFVFLCRKPSMKNSASVRSCYKKVFEVIFVPLVQCKMAPPEEQDPRIEFPISGV